MTVKTIFTVKSAHLILHQLLHALWLALLLQLRAREVA
jgi:hypothetical protein